MTAENWGKNGQPSLVASADLHRLSHRQRAEYYAAHPEAAQPLWDDNYDDTICLTDANGNPDARHFSAMIRYVEDNPRRAVIRRARPEFMRRCLHVVIGGRVAGQGRCRCSAIERRPTAARPTSARMPTAASAWNGNAW